MLQIQSFIQSLGLDNVPPAKETAIEKNKMKKEAIQGLQEAKAAVDEGAELHVPNEVDKKKRRKENAVAEASVSGGGDSGEPLMDEGVNRQLHHLSVKSYKKLLVSMDNEEMWYDQVNYMYMHGFIQKIFGGGGGLVYVLCYLKWQWIEVGLVTSFLPLLIKSISTILFSLVTPLIYAGPEQWSSIPCDC